jgi:fructoselysine-6-P-deglycase FrlB-like protein
MTIDDRRRDPDAPLSGPPDPWAETDMPPRRDGPPWHMTEMIEAEPALAARILDRLGADGSAARLAARVRDSATTGGPVLAVGCGTSEHGAMAVATILGEALDPANGPTGNMQAFEASLMPMPTKGGLLIAVSHEGATWATMRALQTARAAGVVTALVTVSGRAPAAGFADIVLETGELDRSWCHTIGYLSPIVAAIATAGNLVSGPRPDDVRATLAAGLASQSVAAIEALASSMARRTRIVVTAGGIDLIAARELVLKIEEGTHLPAAFRHVETLLHGHLAAMDDQTGLVVVAADGREHAARASRLADALRAARELGLEAGAILAPGYSASIPTELTPGGRVVIPDGGSSLGPAARALLATAIPLQLLTERMARALGVNPDPIRRDDPRYLRAAEASSAG